jgi:hypothetical protein
MSARQAPCFFNPKSLTLGRPAGRIQSSLLLPSRTFEVNRPAGEQNSRFGGRFRGGVRDRAKSCRGGAEASSGELHESAACGASSVSQGTLLQGSRALQEERDGQQHRNRGDGPSDPHAAGFVGELDLVFAGGN